MTVLVDDATHPDDNSLTYPASEGAGELRALKAKINSAFLNTGVGATFPFLINMNGKGWNVDLIDNSAADNYASKFKMQRTANAVNKSSYGVWAEGILANNISITTGTLAGLASVSTVGTGCTVGFVYALNSVIYQQTHNLNATIAGFYILFSDRFTAGVAAPGGLGSNSYNRGATAVLIDAFPRSSSGEYCGWVTGIKFTGGSMDRDIVGPGYCIDFSAITLQAVTGNPRTTYNMKAVIKMSHMMGIIWESGDNVITYYDNVTGRWTLSNGVTKRFEVDVNTGALYRSGVLVP
jgi:hypothetical protein